MLLDKNRSSIFVEWRPDASPLLLVSKKGDTFSSAKEIKRHTSRYLEKVINKGVII
jgi:hypothetical protein